MADEICIDCGRPMARTFGVWSQQRGSVLCGAGKHDAAADLQCAEVKIERLESQLAAVEKLSAAEVQVVDAALEWHKGVGMTADYKPIFAANDGLDAACGALLALRAEANRG